MQLAPLLHRLGSSSMVNSYLIEDAGAITFIDAGLRGHWKDLLRELEAMGRSPVDIRALLLTHGDADHLGFAERLRQEHGVPVFVGEADAAEARGEVPEPAAVRDRMRLVPMAEFLVDGITHVELTSQVVFQPQTWPFEGHVWWLFARVGARGGPEQLIKMATGQLRRWLQNEAIVITELW